MNEREQKLELLKKQIASLSPEKRAIFAKKLKAQNNPTTSTTLDKNSFQKSPEELALSLAQERLWFLHQLEPNNPTYNIPICWNFQGDLDITLVQKVFQEIVNRHDSLKSTFTTSENGKPQIVINKINNLSLPIVDLREINSQEKVKNNLIQKIAKTPFDLTVELPIKINIVRASDTSTSIIIVLHHIAADGWSRGILLKEFTALYRAFCDGKKSPLLNIKTQYTDFAAWQKEWFSGEEQKLQLDYWKNKLDNLTVLKLPTDYKRPPLQTFKGKTLFFSLNSEIVDRLKALSRQQSVTVFMALLTVFKILLHRYSGEDDITIGSPIANRNWQKIENTIGFFVNTLVLRNNLADNPSFTELLHQIKQTTTTAYQNQDVPFAQLVDELQPERDLSHNPLFSVMFQFQNQAYQWQNSRSPKLEIPNLQLTQEWIDIGATKFDLSWHLIERKNEIMVAIEYSTDLYRDATIERMFGHFKTLIQGIIKNPQERLSNLAILTKAERQKILVNWNQTQADFDLDYCFYQLFEKQAKLTPQNIAIEDSQGKIITYTELNKKVNLLTAYLVERGVKIETKVGICLDRSFDLIISLLAIQKAGGVYIPLDPNYPQKRLNYIIEDSQINVLLTQTKHQDKFSTQNLTLINIDTPSTPPTPLCEAVSFRAAPTASPASPAPNNLAYIIYTSGSTGKPKGTMITHRGLVNYLSWAISKYPLTVGKGVPVQSSISFDATITSLYTALLKGQKIVLCTEENELENINRVLNSDANYSLIKLTPAHLNAVTQLTKNKTSVKPANTFVIGGEALTFNTIKYWQKRAPQTTLINEYGPTETVVGCCVYEIPQEYKHDGEVPIGNPIANTQLYILDRYLQPVPIGIPGELYIGGIGVARGYLQQPELTAEKFIPNPFAQTYHGTSLHPARLYKTGDKARYLHDGNIEYLGRIDKQIKIRGFRIELGEIEAVLNRHSLVRSSLVIAIDNRLIAYIVSHRKKEISSDILRSYLKDILPSYSIPNNFVILDRFPLTNNGKIDRKALPIPDLKERNKIITNPRSEKETILVKIWREVLNIDLISIDDNFFELGGDSILSIQIISRAKQQGLIFTPKQLFQNQTIAELAIVAEENQPITIEQGKVVGKVPLTPIQYWFFERDLVDYNRYNQAVLLEVEPSLNINWLTSALQHLIEHHDALRMRFQKVSDCWLQSNLETIPEISFSDLDLTSSSDTDKAKQIKSIAEELQSSLDITQGKLVTGALFRMGNQKRDRLLLIIHHLVIDGISWRILLEDLAIAYRQLKSKQEIKLLSKTTSYKRWGKKLVQYATEEKVLKEVNDWLNIQQNKIAPLPIDRTPLNQSNNIASVEKITIFLDEQNTNTLLTELPKTHNIRVEDALLTALAYSLYLWTNSKQLAIDLESYGREIEFQDIDISRTVGWFTNIYPVHLKIDKVNHPADNLKTIKEQLRQTSSRSFNYGILRYLNSETKQKLQQLPSPEISFNYLGKIQVSQKNSFIKGLATEDIGETKHSSAIRSHLLEINGGIIDDKLQLNWLYSKNRHHERTITKLANNFLLALKDLIIYCTSNHSKNYTPSDFSAAKVNQSDLDKLMSKIKTKK